MLAPVSPTSCARPPVSPPPSPERAPLSGSLCLGPSFLSLPISSPISLSPFPCFILNSPKSYFFLPIFIYCPNSIIPTIKERKRTHNATTLWRQQPRFLHQPQSAAVPFQACPHTAGCNFYRALVSVPPPQTPRWTWGPWGSVFPLSWHLTGCSGIMSVSPSSSKLNPLKEGPLSVPPTPTPSTGLTQSRHSEPQSGVDGMGIAVFSSFFNIYLFGRAGSWLQHVGPFIFTAAWESFYLRHAVPLSCGMWDLVP